MMTKLHLIRHPAVALPTGICYGHTDVRLVEDVTALAQTLRSELPENAVLVSSPLQRCRLLAQALGRPLLDDRLKEIDFGAWEMKRFDLIDRALIDAWASDPLGFCAHGGESVRQMADRAVQCLEETLDTMPESLVIVSHAGPLRAIVGHLLGQSAEQWTQLNLPYGKRFGLQIDGRSAHGWNARRL